MAWRDETAEQGLGAGAWRGHSVALAEASSGDELDEREAQLVRENSSCAGRFHQLGPSPNGNAFASHRADGVSDAEGWGAARRGP
ncbi:MAG: hypothetical protein ABIQ16_17580 [Polyangiaceae bacterium]